MRYRLLLLTLTIAASGCGHSRTLGPFVKNAHVSRDGKSLEVERCQIVFAYSALGGVDLFVGDCWKEKPEPLAPAAP